MDKEQLLLQKVKQGSGKDLSNLLLKLDEDEALEAIKVRCENDFETFCSLFFPHYCHHPFNKFHRDCFEYYSTPKVGARRMDAAPRGYAKSAIKALFKPIHDLAYGYEKYILFFSSTSDQSIQKLKDIRREILTNELLAHVYGISFTSSIVGSKAFEVNTPSGPAYLQAVGSGTEVRGIRFGEHRPTKIILDDVEDSEEVLNEEIRDKKYDWLVEVVANLGSENTNIEIVGTILHKQSLLKRVSKNPAYVSRIYKAVISWSDRQDLWDKWRSIYNDIDNDDRKEHSRTFYSANEKAMLEGTEVLWPEKEPYIALMEEMVEKGRRAFMKEKQNTPLSSDEALFEDLWFYGVDEERGGIVIERTGAFIPWSQLECYGAIDPATGDKKKKKKTKLDFTCIGAGYKDLKGRLFVHQDWTKRARPTKYIEQIFDMQEQLDFEKFAVETNLYRGLLVENLQRERKKRELDRKKRNVENWGIRVPFYEVEQHEQKEKRIFTLEPKVNNGWILFNRALSGEFMDQIEQFPAGDHDDCPDMTEMLWGLINNRYKPCAVDIDMMGAR